MVKSQTTSLAPFLDMERAGGFLLLKSLRSTQMKEFLKFLLAEARKREDKLRIKSRR